MILQRQLAPFASRNYRLFFAGQIVSLVGSWMTQTATVWLVYQHTHSAFWLGVVAFAGQLPGLLIGPAAGVWVDRLERRQLLIATQVVAMLQSLALAYFTLSGRSNSSPPVAMAKAGPRNFAKIGWPPIPPSPASAPN